MASSPVITSKFIYNITFLSFQKFVPTLWLLYLQFVGCFQLFLHSLSCFLVVKTPMVLHRTTFFLLPFSCSCTLLFLFIPLFPDCLLFLYCYNLIKCISFNNNLVFTLFVIILLYLCLFIGSLVLCST